jgi:hypothetical protein
MSYYMQALMTILFFLMASGWFIGQMTGVEYILLSPITLGILAVELGVAIVLGTGTITTLLFSTPFSPRNIALGFFFGTLTLALSFDLIFNSMPIIYGMICVPIYIVLGFIMMEAGKN